MSIETILALMNQRASDEAVRQGIWTLDALRHALKQFPADTPVVFEDGKSPSNLHAYRGYYDRLSIGTKRHRDDYATQLNGGGQGFEAGPLGYYTPGAHDVTIAEPVTAAEMVRALDIADGEEFEGYKGGQYGMHGDTFIHVAEYGDCGRLVVGLLSDLTGRVVIETTEEEF